MEISVIIPVFNACAYLEKAVLSALALKPVKEVILVEDGSTDASARLCESLAQQHPQIKVIYHAGRQNLGAGASRNAGIDVANCDYIAFLDADDYYLANRFDAEEKLFEQAAVEGVYGACGVEYYTNSGREAFHKSFSTELTTVKNKTSPERLIYSLTGVEGNGHFHLDTLTIRKNVLTKNALRFNEGLRLHQDTEWAIRVAFYAKLFPGITENAIAVRGVHDHNRITNITAKHYNRFLLWSSLYEWCKELNPKDELLKSAIILNYKAYRITQADVIIRWTYFIAGILLDKRLLTTNRYFYIYNDRLLTNKTIARIINKLRQIYGKRNR